MSITFFFERVSCYVLAVFAVTLLIQLCIHWIRFSKLAFFKNKTLLKQNDELEPVSIVVCSRDAYEDLMELIPALLSQDYPKFEIVVVNDCSEDETEQYLKDLERVDSRVKPVQLRQHLNFFNGKKFPLSMGIKSASYDLLVLTDADCRPNSEGWLRSVVSQYHPDTQVVLGYCAYRRAGGLLNLLSRFEALQEGLLYLSSAIARKPYMGIGRNLSYRKELFFNHKGFTSHYTSPAGDDDVFISQVATKQNTEVQIDADNAVTCRPPSSVAGWFRERSARYSTIKMHRPSKRAFWALHYWSQFLFYASFIALFFLAPAFTLSLEIPYTLYYYGFFILLFLLRYLTQLIIYRGASRRLGEQGLLAGLILWDFLLAILTPLLRLSGRMRQSRSLGM